MMILPAILFSSLALVSAETKCHKHNTGWLRCNGAWEKDVTSSNNEQITELTLYNSEMPSITKNLLSRFPKLQFFSARMHNEIIGIDDDAFKGLAELQWVDVSNNQIRKIDANLFSDANNLENLDVSDNVQFFIPENRPVINSNSLKRLDISSCGIRTLSLETFEALPNLIYLHLERNILSYLHPDAFKNNRHLKKLWLQSNQFSTLSPAIFDGLQVTNVRLEDNPWHCDCSLTDLVLFEKENKVSTGVWCKNLDNLPWKDLNIQPRCTCRLNKLGDWMRCNAIEEVKLPSTPRKDTTSLSLYNSRIQRLHRGLFQNFPKLKFFHAKINNNIETIDDNAFKELTSLQHVDLSNNKITSINNNIFSDALAFDHLNIRGNENLEVPKNDPFLKSRTLTWLDMSSCKIREVNVKTFDQLRSLSQLRLERNLLSSLPSNIFRNNRLLEKLWLHGNQFTTMSPNLFEGLQLTNLRFENNPWNCDCKLSPLILWAREEKKDTDIFCETPAVQKWADIGEPPQCKKVLSLCKVLYPGEDDENC